MRSQAIDDLLDRDFLTPTIARIIEGDTEGTQRDFARACKRHESWVSQLKVGKASLLAREVVPFCSYYANTEVYEAIGDRLGLGVVELAKPRSSPGSVRRSLATLLQDVARAALEIEDALEDEAITRPESIIIAGMLQAVIESARATKARLPYGGRR